MDYSGGHCKLSGLYIKGNTHKHIIVCLNSHSSCIKMLHQEMPFSYCHFITFFHWVCTNMSVWLTAINDILLDNVCALNCRARKNLIHFTVIIQLLILLFKAIIFKTFITFLSLTAIQRYSCLNLWRFLNRLTNQRRPEKGAGACTCQSINILPKVFPESS